MSLKNLHRAFDLSGVILCAGLAVACGRGPATAPTGPVVQLSFERVPYPPPAAFVELVPTPPGPDLVWIDGHWAWRGSRYLWQRGGWVRPPESGYYAPWKMVYTADGHLMFAESAWFDARGRRLPRPNVVTPATTPPNELTAEERQSGR